MADRVLQATLRVQTAQWESGMLSAARTMEKFSTDARAMGRFVSATFREIATPTERLETQMRKLDTVLAKGRITTEEHARAMGRLTAEYNRASDAASKLAIAEQNTRFLGRFNESRASLAAGESRAELMARMSGGGGSLDGAARTLAAGASALNRSSIELSTATKFLKASGLAEAAGALKGFASLGPAILVALTIRNALRRVDDVAGGDQSPFLNRSDAQAVVAAKGIAGRMWDYFGDAVAAGGITAFKQLPGGNFALARLAESERLQAQVAARNQEAQERQQGIDAARAPLRQFELQQRVEFLTEGRSVESLKALAEQKALNGEIELSRALYAAVVQLQKEGIAAAAEQAEKEAKRASAVAAQFNAIDATLDERDKQLRIQRNIEQGDTPTVAKLREEGAGVDQLQRARLQDVEDQQREERRVNLAQQRADAERRAKEQMEEQNRLAMERERIERQAVERIRGFADQQIAAHLTPQERFAEFQQRLRQATTAGFLNDEQARRAFDAAAADLQASGLANARLPAALEPGSSAFVSALNQDAAAKRTEKKFDDLIAVERKKLDEAKEANDLLEEIVDQVQGDILAFF